jgi:hypothetical protein
MEIQAAGQQQSNALGYQQLVSQEQQSMNQNAIQQGYLALAGQQAGANNDDYNG